MATMMAPPAQTTPPPPPPGHHPFSASTDATQPLPDAAAARLPDAASVSTSSCGDARRQLSIADGKRLLEQYRRLKAQALAGPRVLAQLEGKCRALEEAMADVVLESDDRREEAEALFAENKALQAQLKDLKETLQASEARAAEATAASSARRAAVAAGLPALKAQLARELDLAVRREADVAEAGAAAARLRSERDWLRSEHARSLGAAGRSEESLAAVLNELRSTATAVAAQSTAADALATNADRADGRAERAEAQVAALRAAAADAKSALDGAKRDAKEQKKNTLLACDRLAQTAEGRAEAQREVARLQALLAENHNAASQAMRDYNSN